MRLPELWSVFGAPQAPLECGLSHARRGHAFNPLLIRRRFTHCSSAPSQCRGCGVKCCGLRPCQDHSSANDDRRPSPHHQRRLLPVHLGDVTVSFRKHQRPPKALGRWWDFMCVPQMVYLHFFFIGYNATRY